MQKQPKPEPLGLSMAKLVLVAAIIASLGAALGITTYIIKNKPAIIPVNIEDETADWKIYRNEEYGFEVKYPKDFSFKATYGHVGPGVPGGEYKNTAVAIHFVVFTINPIYPNGPKERPIITILIYTKKQWEDFGLKDYQNLLSNRGEALFLGENKELIFISDNLTYEPNASKNFTYKSSLIDQILSTFKFIEK